MKSLLVCSTTLLAAASLMAADKDDVTSALQKLAAADNYSWTATTESGGGQNGPGTTKGKTQKDGLISIEMTRGDNTTEAFKMGEKGAVKGDDGWTAVDLAAAPARGGGGGGGGANPARMAGMMLRNLKAPAAEVEDVVSKAKDITKSGDAYAADLSEDTVKTMLTRGGGGRRGGGGGAGGAAPTVTNAKGSVKFWIKDGVISKYEIKVSGTVSRGGNDRDVDRTTTVEIKDIGTTKIALPDEAKSKLS